jgi:cation diffusion facilitator CzcD-associated flavoprotein CzcO
VSVLDWVIVGGGIHGVHLAARLVGEARVKPEGIRIVDPAPRLLDSWFRCTANTGMTHLRSPGVHHLDLDPWALLRFAGDKRTRKKNRHLFAQPYDRPAVGLFADHCAHVIETYGLAALHVPDRVARITLDCDAATVHLDGGASLATERVILALGAGSHPREPDWAASARAQGLRVQHVFALDFELDPKDWPERVAIVGGGITAAQVALRLATDGRVVDLISRHAARKHTFDSDPGWLGPKHMHRFSRIRDADARRALIRGARHRGSMPAPIYRRLRAAMVAGRIHWHDGEVEEVDDAALVLDGSRLDVGAVLLATGFESARPGGRLVDELVETHDLPCASCGYPRVDGHLRWHPRVFVSGPLAELEIGPVSRNIVGARRAAERIVPVARKRRPVTPAAATA